jgi:FlaA1/EpsC-like NDP-sugar epimerase
MINLIGKKNFWLMLLFDIILVTCAYGLSYLIRFEGKIPAGHLHILQNTIFWIVLVKVMFFFYFNLYRGMWRYTSLVDFMNVMKAVVSSSLSIILLILFLFNFQGFSRSVYILDFLLTLVFIAGIRLGIRIYLSRKPTAFLSVFGKKDRKVKRILLIGAGNTGEHVLRELMDNPAINMLPIGFLDDDRTKFHQEIHGIPVLGRIDQIDEIKADYEGILICTPSATGAQMRRIVEICERSGKPVKTMPPLGELIDGRISLKLIREVSMTDIIGREEVRLDDEEIKRYLLGKRVLITGAGGSIGRELLRQIGRFKPEAVALLDFSEYNLYQVEMECRRRFKEIEVETCLVDLVDLCRTRRMFEHFRPNVVFHAAAYKHVPMQELNPWEAVCNNLLAMKNVTACSIDIGVDKFVLVSSDKAVRPTNVMGATKHICELMASCGNGNSKTCFISVRFGNVVGSSGSVVPLFQQQIAQGGPVTVTHPEITRYFMSIPEAAQLILQAGAMGKGREIFILKMGEPIRILDLARDVIRFHGFEPEKDIEIVFTGLRPGEKLYEELITEGEGIVPTYHDKIMVLIPDQCDNHDHLSQQVDELIRVADTFNIPAIKAKLKEIVPEYTPQ